MPSHNNAWLAGAVDLDGYGGGSGAIVRRFVNCFSTETLLTSCSFRIPDLEVHSQDAGIRCQPG